MQHEIKQPSLGNRYLPKKSETMQRQSSSEKLSEVIPLDNYKNFLYGTFVHSNSPHFFNPSYKITVLLVTKC